MSEPTNYVSAHDAVKELWQRCKEQVEEIERLRSTLLSIYAAAMAAQIKACSSQCGCEYIFAHIAKKAGGGDE